MPAHSMSRLKSLLKKSHNTRTPKGCLLPIMNCMCTRKILPAFVQFFFWQLPFFFFFFFASLPQVHEKSTRKGEKEDKYVKKKKPSSQVSSYTSAPPLPISYHLITHMRPQRQAVLAQPFGLRRR